jgi:hypothetical protein
MIKRILILLLLASCFFFVKYKNSQHFIPSETRARFNDSFFGKVKGYKLYKKGTFDVFLESDTRDTIYSLSRQRCEKYFSPYSGDIYVQKKEHSVFLLILRRDSVGNFYLTDSIPY